MSGTNLIAARREDLKAAKAIIEELLPARLAARAQRIIRMAQIAVGADPKLAACSSSSILRGTVQAAALDLEIGGVSGLAYLIPFKREATLIIGYQGYLHLARKAGIRVEAQVVWAHDQFEYSYGLDKALKHVPVDAPDGWKPNREDVRYSYAVARYPDAYTDFEVLTKPMIERRRKASRAKDSGPWVDYYDEMARKSAIRALAKRLPKDVDLEAAIELDKRADLGYATAYSEVLDEIPEIPEIVDGASQADAVEQGTKTVVDDLRKMLADAGTQDDMDRVADMIATAGEDVIAALQDEFMEKQRGMTAEPAPEKPKKPKKGAKPKGGWGKSPNDPSGDDQAGMLE